MPLFMRSIPALPSLITCTSVLETLTISGRLRQIVYTFPISSCLSHPTKLQLHQLALEVLMMPRVNSRSSFKNVRSRSNHKNLFVRALSCISPCLIDHRSYPSHQRYPQLSSVPACKIVAQVYNPQKSLSATVLPFASSPNPSVAGWI